MAKGKHERPDLIPRQTERLVVLALTGLLLLNYPLLGLFDSHQIWFGMPLLYLYLFTTWAVFILLVALVLEWTASRKGENGRK